MGGERHESCVRDAKDTFSVFSFDLSINMGDEEVGEEPFNDFFDDAIDDDRDLDGDVGNTLRHRRR